MGSRIRQHIGLSVLSVFYLLCFCGCVFNVGNTVNIYQHPENTVSSDTQSSMPIGQGDISSAGGSASGNGESGGRTGSKTESEAATEAEKHDRSEDEYFYEYEAGEFLEVPPPAIATKDGFRSETVEKELLFLINLARKDGKCAPLKKQSLLQWSARVRSSEYSLNGASDSAGIDGSWAESLAAVGYSSFDEVNEAATLLQDVESLYSEAAKVDNAVLSRLIFDAWRSNDDLNLLILSNQIDEVGISVIRDGQNLYTVAHFSSLTEE